MKVAYFFGSSNAQVILSKMIVPQLEEKRHNAYVVGMFFFGDNTYMIKAGDSLGEKINQLAQDLGMLVMGCDYCCYQRDIADKLIANAKIGCFPDLYSAIEKAGGIDQVISL